MVIAASNKFNIEATRGASAIDVDAPFAPTTQTLHGYGIQVGGVYIGRLRSISPPDLDREFTHQYELHPKTFAQPVDGVPGRATNFELGYARAEVWNEEIERAFGESFSYNLLIDQRAPFTIDEVFMRGPSVYRVNRYAGCWFRSKSYGTFEAEGNGVIEVTGNIAFVNKITYMNRPRG